MESHQQAPIKASSLENKKKEELYEHRSDKEIRAINPNIRDLASWSSTLPLRGRRARTHSHFQMIFLTPPPLAHTHI